MTSKYPDKERLLDVGKTITKPALSSFERKGYGDTPHGSARVIGQPGIDRHSNVLVENAADY